jgi:hypothetical protein
VSDTAPPAREQLARVLELVDQAAADLERAALAMRALVKVNGGDLDLTFALQLEGAIIDAIRVCRRRVGFRRERQDLVDLVVRTLQGELPPPGVSPSRRRDRRGRVSV